MRISQFLAMTGSLLFTAPIIKDQILYGIENQQDKKIRHLIQKGLFFDVPYFSEENTQRVGVAAYGKEFLPIKARLTSTQVKVMWQGQDISVKSDTHGAFAEFESNNKEKEEIENYCIETLKGMNSVSTLSLLFGFKTASQKIMVESAFKTPRTYTPMEEKIAEQRLIRQIEQRNANKVKKN